MSKTERDAKRERRRIKSKLKKDKNRKGEQQILK